MQPNIEQRLALRRLEELLDESLTDRMQEETGSLVVVVKPAEIGVPGVYAFIWRNGRVHFSPSQYAGVED